MEKRERERWERKGREKSGRNGLKNDCRILMPNKGVMTGPSPMERYFAFGYNGIIDLFGDYGIFIFACYHRT